MPINCKENDCIYCCEGECGLTHAVSAGEYTSSGCAYFVKRADKNTAL